MLCRSILFLLGVKLLLLFCSLSLFLSSVSNIPFSGRLGGRDDEKYKEVLSVCGFRAIELSPEPHIFTRHYLFMPYERIVVYTVHVVYSYSYR